MQAEFAVAVCSDLKGRNLGSLLLARLVRCMRGPRTGRLVGIAPADNHRMLALARRHGCSFAASRDNRESSTFGLRMPRRATYTL